MLASITACYNGLLEDQGTSTSLQTSEGTHPSDIGFGRQSGFPRPFPPSELSRGVHPYKASSTWSFTDTSCCLVNEAEATAVSNIASVFCAPVEEVERGSSKRTIQSGELLVRARSMLEVSSTVAPRFRAKSADFALKGAESMQCQTGSLRTLEDASSSSLPLDPHRSTSTSTAATESTGIHVSVASLVKKRQEIEEQMIHLQVQLLESLREEWILTGVIPEGFTELQSQVIASNPKLKTTSFPFAHLLTNSRSEPNCNNEMVDKTVFDMSNYCWNGYLRNQKDFALTTISEACVAFGKPVGTVNDKLTCKDSLTSSFSSVMGDSLCLSQWDETSTRTSDSLGDCAHDEARELISKRLQSLETDCAIVSQLYRAHKQRATETNRPAFRKAYKCNAQKLKEIHREKRALEEQLRVMKIDEQSNVVSGLTRSNSLSAQANVNQAFSLFNPPSVAMPSMSTLPRRRTLQFPSMSSSNTLHLGKLRKRSSVKYAGIEKCATPMVYSQEAEKSISQVPGPLRVRTPRVTPFSTLFRFQGQRSRLESGESKTNKTTKLEMTEVVETAQTLHRPYSLLEPVSSGQRCESKFALNLTQLKRPISSPALNRSHKEELPPNSTWSCSLEALRSDLSDKDDEKGTTDEQAKLKLVISDHRTKYTGSSSSSDAQSPPGCYPTTTQSSAVVKPSSNAPEVCLRRSAGVELRESSIRCICSCISEHGGSCECAEEINEDKEPESDPSKGIQQSPAPPRRKLTVIMPRKQTYRNLNPLSLLRPRSSRRSSLFNL